MPRKGYHSLTLPESDYRRLLELAKAYGTTAPKYLGILISEPESLSVPPSFGQAFDGTKVYGAPDGIRTQSFLATFDAPDEKRLIKKVLQPAELTSCTVHPDDYTKFERFYTIDRGKTRGTAQRHRQRVRKLVEAAGSEIDAEAIRTFLEGLKGRSDYNNYVKSFRVFFRDFKGAGSLVESFGFTSVSYRANRLFTKPELREFYWALETPSERAKFLLYATTGRRRMEILMLTPGEIEVENRTILPGNNSATKHTWYSFFNEEAKEALEEYLKGGQVCKYLFPQRKAERDRLFVAAQKKTGLPITPGALRYWFANEMAYLGMADRFVNALQGRISRTVLERHYSEYGPRNLKAIYDRAGLKVLS